MAKVYVARTLPVNPPDAPFILTRATLWAALQRKTRRAPEFVPSITECTVLKDEGDFVVRNALMIDYDGEPRMMHEEVTSFGQQWIRFVQPNGSVTTNLISNGPENMGRDLQLSYIFEWVPPEGEEGGEEAYNKAFKFLNEYAVRDTRDLPRLQPAGHSSLLRTLANPVQLFYQSIQAPQNPAMSAIEVDLARRHSLVSGSLAQGKSRKLTRYVYTQLRTVRNRKPQQLRSAPQESQDSRNGTESGQQDSQSQESNITANDTETATPSQSNRGDLTYSNIELEPSIDLTSDQMSPPRINAFANLSIPGLFGELGLPLFSRDMMDDGSRGNRYTGFDSMAVDGQTTLNPDWLSYIPRLNEIDTSGLPLSEVSSSHITNGTEVTTEATDRSKHKIYLNQHYNTLSLETSLILHGILALSARFSSSPEFDGILPAQRGEPFGRRAKAIYDESIHTLQQPTLRYLQGCILLAFYLYSSEPDSQGWLVIGMCSRLAYDLGLNKVDETNLNEQQSRDICNREWSMREELRRAWWCVWELDAFASGIACRLPTIDRTTIQVLLPVSDKAWFADSPVQSAMIDPNPPRAWHTLRDCQNQDERAWFLVINFFLLLTHGLVQQKRPDPQQIRDVEAAVACYGLLLPPQFHLGSGSLLFSSENFRKSNWIILTNIMLLGCRTFIRFLSESENSVTCSHSTNQLFASLAAGSRIGACKMDYRPYTDDILRAIRIWSPECIPYNSPFMGCLIIGPAAIYLRVAKDLRKGTNADGHTPGIEAELLTLALAQMARFWKIGSGILDGNACGERNNKPPESTYEECLCVMSSHGGIKEVPVAVADDSIVSQPVKNVALAGATGTIGTAILHSLLNCGDFSVTILTHKPSEHDFPPSVKVISVDYKSVDSISAALQGQDVLISCLGTAVLAKQRQLIDAAIAVKVKRFIPSEFGKDYLVDRARDGRITYTLICNGAFLDWAIQAGMLIDLKGRKAILYDGGDQPVSATRLSVVGKAVVGVLTHYDKTTNRCIYIQDIAISQRRLLALAQKLTPQETWSVETADTAQLEAEAREQLSKGYSDPRIWYAFIKRAGFGDGYGSHFEKLDNDLLSIPEMTEGEVGLLMASLMEQNNPSAR
ncbi:hypothetical protein B7463_g8981, partial [Scytalidium lignicola]